MSSSMDKIKSERGLMSVRSSEKAEKHQKEPYSDERKERIWKLAKNWMSHCAEHHDENHDLTTTSYGYFCPTRLIDVGSPILHLVELSTVTHVTPTYAAVSYCWGPNMPTAAMTVEANLRDHRRGINLASLPQTFRDVIEIARGIGVRYLWIDALCIIQDSKLDWETEAASMSKVYARSIVTIAAAASDNCDGGCLYTPRNTKLLDEPSHLWWVSHFGASPLLMRGWCLQERELSPRILHFTAGRVIWECKQQRCAEDISSSVDFSVEQKESYLSHSYLRCLDVPVTVHINEFLADGAKTHIQPEKMQYDTAYVLELWRDKIIDYSCREFSQLDDRLPAISGLASALLGALSCKYIAGFWEKDLPFALLWNTGGVSYRVQSRNWLIYFPTWSWVSVSSEVYWPVDLKYQVDLGDNFTSTEKVRLVHPYPSPLCVEVLKVETFPTGFDTRGNISTGYIHLRGRIKIFQLSQESKSITGTDTIFDIDERKKSYDIVYLLSLLIEHSPSQSTRGSINPSDIIHGLIVIRSDSQKAIYANVPAALTPSKFPFERIGTFNTRVDSHNWDIDFEDTDIILIYGIGGSLSSKTL